MTPSTVSFDLGATGWFVGSTLYLPPSNNTAELAASRLEFPATYELQISARLDGVTQKCPAFSVSVDYLDCNHSDPLTYLPHTTALQLANITATLPSAETYTMGDPPMDVTFEAFVIGFCNITGYTVEYKTTSG